MLLLLLLCSPYPEPELESGKGDVLVEMAVHWVLEPGPHGPTPSSVHVEERGSLTYAGGQVLAATSCPGVCSGEGRGALGS